MLVIEGLTARYGVIDAVRSIDLEVREGEIVALLGPNGAGKTTVLSAVMALLRPASGSIVFQGRDITGLPTESIVRLGVALVPEHRRIFQRLTVRENLRLGAAGPGRRGSQADLDMLLDLFPILADRMDSPAGFLSGGESQQLAIARAVVSQPRLLLLDEPSLGLAPLVVDAVFGLIGDLRSRGFTILLVEQNAFQAVQIADRAAIMRSGRIDLTSETTDVRDSDALLDAYLGVRL